MDRSPGAMVVPMNLIGFFKPQMTIIFIGSLHLFSLITICRIYYSYFLPAFYIAIVSFHFEIIPIDLYTSIATSRVKVPFSPLLEAFIMEITLEMLREAGIRLPQPIGQTIGIVGGIVIGQAAVQAGLVSNVMVIIVSITAIASFIVSNYDLSSSIRLIRFPMMLLAYFYGVVGIVSGLMLLFAHFVSLTSYGSPYGLPIAPFRLQELKDSFVRFPISMITTRSSTGQPKQEKKKKVVRMGNLKFKNITLFEFIIFIHSLQLASGMLIMPSPLATTAGTDGWISIILGWMVTSIIGVFIILMLQKSQQKFLANLKNILW